MVLLTHLTVKVSGIIPAEIEVAWAIVREFGAVGKWLTPEPQAGLSMVKSQLLPGCVEGQIGTLRVVTMGNSSYVEQLECLDDDVKTIKWKLISHPMNSNPFPATFLNLKCRISLLEVTRDDSTYMVWAADFDTDFEGTEAMRSEIKAYLEAGFDGLTALLAPMPPGSLLQSLENLPSSVTPMIGNVPLTIPSGNTGGGSTSPTAMKAGLARSGGAPLESAATLQQKAASQALAGELSAVFAQQSMRAQQALLQQQQQQQQYQQQEQDTQQHPAPFQPLKDSMALGSVATGSFTFPSFNLPSSDTGVMNWVQQRRMEQQREEAVRRASMDSAATSKSAPAANPAIQDAPHTYSTVLQLQREFPLLEPQQIEALLAAQSQMQKDPTRAFIQQGYNFQAPNLSRNSGGSHDSIGGRASVERRGDSANSDIVTNPASPLHSPRGSLGSRQSKASAPAVDRPSSSLGDA